MATADKRHVLLLDDNKEETDKLEIVLSKLRDLNGTRALGESYYFSSEILPREVAVWSAEQIAGWVDDTAAKHQGPDSPCVLLVDLFIVNDPSKNRDVFRPLIDGVRRAFPRTPVIVYTRGPVDKHTLRDLFLMSIDCLIVIPTTRDLPKTLLYGQISSAGQRSRDRLQQAISGQFGVPPWFRVSWTESVPDDGLFGFKAAAEALVSEIFGKYSDYQRVELAEMNPGFSGTRLLRVTPYYDKVALSKSWIVKIAQHSEDLAKLQNEVDGYQTLLKRGLGEFIPQPGFGGSLSPVHILPEWWGAITMSFEKDFRTVLEVFDTHDVAKVYEAVFEKCLKHLYVTKKLFPLNAVPPSEKLARKIPDAAKKLERHLPLARMCAAAFDIPRVFGMLEDCVKIAADIRDRLKEGTEWFGYDYIHGDLNCRNLLVNNDGSGFKLIDFPKVVGNEKPTAACMDFVKAETELYFIILDYGSGLDVDMNRLTYWVGLLKWSLSAMVPDEYTCPDSHIARVSQCVRSIRGAYADLVGADSMSATQYKLFSLQYALGYLTYPDVTVAKKIAAALYAKMLVDDLLKA